MPDAQPTSNRPQLISAVRTPLGFFSLIVLVFEGILVWVVSNGSAGDRTFLIRAIVVTIALLIAIVTAFAIWRPELFGLKPRPRDIDPSSVTKLNEEIQKLKSENEELERKLSLLKKADEKARLKNSEDDLKRQIRASISSHRAATLDMILQDIHGIGLEGRGKVQSLITTLMDDDLIEPDTIPGFYRTKSR